MTESSARPAIRKAPDTDRHPALAAEVQVDLRASKVESSLEFSPEPAPEPETAKKSFWSQIFSRS